MGRVALVTGGTRGIGAATAKFLKAEGFAVSANYAADDAAAAAFAEETGIATCKWSVADREACARGVIEVEADLGPIEILVNNAGIARDAMFHRMTARQWHEVIDANLNGVFNMTHPVWPGMRDRGFGRIIAISSVNAQAGQMGHANYAASKAGLLGFVKALALEGARKGITVNAVCPGYVSTDMVTVAPEHVRRAILAGIPLGRMGEPEEIARCVAFLASDEAGFITGSTLSANGGQHMA